MISDTISNRLGTAKIYHKGYQKYVKNTVLEYVLELGDPESKTSVAVAVTGVAVVTAVCLALFWYGKTK